jgi:acyl-CoA thioester hydrolase
MSNAKAAFSWPIRVYFHDTDAGGVVFHGNYLHFMEAARTEFLQSLGFSVLDLQNSGDALFVVYALTMNFHKSAKLHDELRITASLDRVGRARLAFDQRILRGDETLVSAKVNIACVDPRTLKPTSLPEALKARAADPRYATPAY